MAQIDSLRTEEKFKKTEIGEIPVDWGVVRLGDVAQINMGQSPPSRVCFDYENGLPFFQGKAEFGFKHPKVGKWCSSPMKVAEKDDILISVRAPVGDVNLAPERCCIGRGLAAIRGTKSYNNFLYFVMNFIKDSLAKIGQGSTFKAINKNALFELKVPNPALSEQKKIAEILSTIDQAIEKSNEIIEKTKELKKDLMQELLTRGIGHKKLKKTEVGEIPVEWEVGRFSDVCVINPYYKVPKGAECAFVEMASVDSCRPDVSYFGKRTAGKTGGTRFKNGDTLFARITPCTQNGKIALIRNLPTEYGLGSTEFIVLSPKPKIMDSYFLFYSVKQERVRKYATGRMIGTTGRQRVPAEVFKNELYLPIPPLSEQKKTAEILSTVDEEIEEAVTQKEKLENIKKGLMQVLLTGKVRTRAGV